MVNNLLLVETPIPTGERVFQKQPSLECIASKHKVNMGCMYMAIDTVTYAV